MFPLEDPEEVVLTINMPVDGFATLFVHHYLLHVLVPVVVSCLLVMPWLCLLKLKRGLFFEFSFIVLMIVLSVCDFVLKIPFAEYRRVYEDWNNKGEYTQSDFFEKNYVPVDSSSMKAVVDSTKNLVLIMMESMENWPDSMIPEMEKLAADNIHFTSFESEFSGGVEIAGSTCTITSSVSKLTGVPYVASKFTGDTIFPRAKSIYDLLKDYGYRNVFLQGSDAKFANFDRFLRAHSVDEIYDINKLKNFVDMSSEYREGREYAPGITDGTLYKVAKNVLDTLAQNGKFTMTLATIETHYPYGFYDNRCLEKPLDSSHEENYKAVLKCASREVYEFVTWIQNRKFGANTQIVIVGDHLFRGKILVNRPNRRWIDIFINAGSRDSLNNVRNFSSVDMAPTIIEGLGFELVKHRMGFGASLFSSESTLIEKYPDQNNLNYQIKQIVYSPEYYMLMQSRNKF